MERINQFAFYELGKALRKLALLEGDVDPSIAVLDVLQGKEQLGQFLEGKPIPLGVSRVRAEELFEQLEAIERDHFSDTDSTGKVTFKLPAQGEPSIPAWRWFRIKRALESFEVIFQEELREATTFYAPRRGIYWTPALVDTADDSFPADLVAQIPQRTREDWRTAGRCLAFGLYSASGFHVIRAVEGSMEAYYQIFNRKLGITLISMKDYIVALENIMHAQASPAPSEKLIAEMRQMMDTYGNPIIHHRFVLSEIDARMLFIQGENIIIAMAREIAGFRVATQPASQPALAYSAEAAAG